ncbi:MAG: squalene synthase HpnC [Alphaproteobacteria bacterium]|jgi:hydroxysqualene synthase|nr:squalene synthase HpnC [Alphaproteobacteria bacterium]MBT7943140.1 squalene synthase HpnC [Alphaproteobacteria bacterium]
MPGNPGSENSLPSAEIPSGKDAAYENFPVGSWLLPASLRPHIASFYAFARAIDDIADSPDLEAAEKVRRLEGFEVSLIDPNADDPAYSTAHAMRRSLTETGISAAHCIDLITAFKRDATKLRYQDWDDLMGYCIVSAAPVGRYLVDLHGGSSDGYGPSDALCNALQVINHLQDCQDDYQTLDRVYLPGDWMNDAGVVVEDLSKGVSSPGMRRVLDRCLDGTEALMVEARRLPGGLKSRRMAMESAVIIEIAERLIRCLREGDPLGPVRIKLTKPGYLWCCIKGVGRAWL